MSELEPDISRDREKMVAELERLEPSAKARAILLRKDNAGLARTIKRLREAEELVRRVGHIHATGLDLRLAERADGTPAVPPITLFKA